MVVQLIEDTEMSGDGGDNAHNNAFGGGKNPGIGNSGSGNHSGSSGNNGNSGGGHFTGPSMTVDANGEVHVNFSGYEKDKNKLGGNSGGHGGNGKGGGNQVNGATITPNPEKPGSYISSDPGKTMLASSIDDNSANGTNSYTLHTGKNQTIKVTVPNGNIDKMSVEYNNWKGPKLNHKAVKKFITGFMAFRKTEDEYNEKEALLKASELIADMGEKIGARLGGNTKLWQKRLRITLKTFREKRFVPINRQ